MADPFRSVQPGEPVTFNAIAWNAMLGAGKAYRNDLISSRGEALTTTRSSALVRILNNTGSDLDRFAVVGLDGPIFDAATSEDAFLREVTFAGITPDAVDHLGKFAVLLEPAPADRVVRAWVAGVTQVWLNVVDDGHEYADVADGNTAYLETSTYGSAKILWREGTGGYVGYGYGTGEQWAMVLLGALPMPLGLAKVTTEITKATSATQLGKGKIQRYTTLSSSGVLGGLTGVDEDCYSFNRDKKIKVNSTVPIARLMNRWFAINVDTCDNLAT